MSRVILDYNIDFGSLYYYDVTSPSGLRHKIDNNGRSNKRHKGDVAGSIRKNKKANVWIVKVDGVAYVAHRVIWKLFHSHISHTMIIDHIDGDSLNNNILNLRLTTQTINNRNHRKQINNTTGHTGIRLHGNRWRAYWNDCVTGKQKSKSFNITTYGNDALSKAIEYRNLMLSNEYTTRHGK